VQAAAEGGCQRLLTEDLHASWTTDRLRVENPFA
jgi:predicted nucleic acid-binding protein